KIAAHLLIRPLGGPDDQKCFRLQNSRCIVCIVFRADHDLPHLANLLLSTIDYIISDDAVLPALHAKYASNVPAGNDGFRGIAEYHIGGIRQIGGEFRQSHQT
ncbi:MAG: hypothetical protein KDG51_08165, partial [Calditrichaeota bacterium]|nr:hypothetical protein [Calditrichota bacterium]